MSDHMRKVRNSFVAFASAVAITLVLPVNTAHARVRFDDCDGPKKDFAFIKFHWGIEDRGTRWGCLSGDGSFNSGKWWVDLINASNYRIALHDCNGKSVIRIQKGQERDWERKGNAMCVKEIVLSR